MKPHLIIIPLFLLIVGCTPHTLIATGPIINGCAAYEYIDYMQDAGTGNVYVNDTNSTLLGVSYLC